MKEIHDETYLIKTKSHPSADKNGRNEGNAQNHSIQQLYKLKS